LTVDIGPLFQICDECAQVIAECRIVGGLEVMVLGFHVVLALFVELPIRKVLFVDSLPHFFEFIVASQQEIIPVLEFPYDCRVPFLLILHGLLLEYALAELPSCKVQLIFQPCYFNLSVHYDLFSGVDVGVLLHLVVDLRTVFLHKLPHSFHFQAWNVR
jgi:hypothetical protein